METKKASAVITTALSATNDAVTFTVKDAGELTLELARISDANKARAMLHGFVQRISDAAALSRNPETGKPASAQDKFDAMRILIEHYHSGTGEWTRTRAAGPKYSNGLLGECLKRLYPDKTAERIAEYLDGLKPSQRTQLLASDKIRPIAEAIRAEAAKEMKVDADALLAGLED